MNKLFKIFIMVFVVSILCACGVKKVETVEDIEDRLKKNSFSVTDVTDQMNDKRINYVAAANNGKYQIEYYVFNEEKEANKAYKSNKASFNVSNTKGKEKSTSTYKVYTQELSDTYNVVIIDKKILMYSSVNIEYKKDLKKVLRKLGY